MAQANRTRGTASLLKTGLLAGAAFVLGAGPALAQEAANGSETIVVTATKREQSLQDVPISITVFSAQDIEQSRIESFSDYALRSPNVGFSSPGGDRSDVRFSIRGVGPISRGGAGNSVGVYLDEFNIAPNILARTVDTQLQDAAQIEILRGPQGTFFGRNTVGGAVSITTIKPDFDAISGEVRAEYSSFDTYAIEGSVNVPLTDTLAVRALAYYDESDGFLEQDGPFEDANATENYGFRVAGRWQPTEATTVDLSAFYSNQQQELPNFVPTGFNSEGVQLLEDLISGAVGAPFTVSDIAGLIGAADPLADGTFPDNERTMNTDIGRPSENETITLIARVEHDFDFATLTVVGGYIDNQYELSGEGDYTANPSFTVGRETELEAYSLEARLSGETDDFTWLAGVFYGHDEVEQFQTTTHLASDPFVSVPLPGVGLSAYDLAFFCIGGLSGLPGCPDGFSAPGFAPFIPGVNTNVGLWENVRFGSEVESFAFFFDGSYDITDRFDVSFGGRVTVEDVSGFRVEGPLTDVFAPRVSNPGSSESFTDFSPRLALTYAVTDDLTTYVTASRGFRSGGANPVPDDPDTSEDEGTFEQESIWNYEVGAKGVWFNGALRASIAAFYMDWEDIQIRAQDPITQRQIIQNASSATNKGIEIELGVQPVDGLDLVFTYGYLDSEFGDFQDARTLDGATIDATGNDLPNSPDNTFSFVGRYEQPIYGSLLGFVQAEYTYIDEIQEDIAANERRLNDAYELVNFRVGVDHEHYAVYGFVENAFDESYRFGTQNLETFLSGAQATVGEGRRYGVEVIGRF